MGAAPRHLSALGPCRRRHYRSPFFLRPLLRPPHRSATLCRHIAAVPHLAPHHHRLARHTAAAFLCQAAYGISRPGTHHIPHHCPAHRHPRPPHHLRSRRLHRLWRGLRPRYARRQPRRPTRQSRQILQRHTLRNPRRDRRDRPPLNHHILLRPQPRPPAVVRQYVQLPGISRTPRRHHRQDQSKTLRGRLRRHPPPLRPIR